MKRIALIISLLIPLANSAHSGHGVVDNGLGHYLFSPMHLIGLGVVLFVGFGLYKIYRSRNKSHA